MIANRREFLQAGVGLAVGGLLAAREVSGQTADKPAYVDCHTHFYDPTRPEGIPWPSKDDRPLYRPVLPRHFLELAAPLGVTQTVVVEASPRVEDNAWLLELADKNPAVVGVVGNLTPGRAEFADHVKRFSSHKRFRGIRIGHDALQAGLAQPDFLVDIRRLAEHDLELDVNGGPSMPADIARLAEKIPDLRIVVNHLANLDLDGRSPPAAWREGMEAAARHPRVYCKVSALVEHARPSGAKPDAPAPADVDFYRPVLDAIWGIFGDDRLIYGSNWPVSERPATYETLFYIVEKYVKDRGPAAVEKFFWKNARAAYRYAE
jgi:predicted TIM-barrel fold metal-dependent hydrolase